MEIYKYTIRRKVIIMICTVCAFIILLTSMPPSHKRTSYSLPKFAFQEEPISGIMSTQLTANSNDQNNQNLDEAGKADIESTTLTPLPANNLPELPHANGKLSAKFNLTTQLNSILTLVYGQRVPIFLIEQCILWQLLKPEEREKLTVRRSVDPFTGECTRSNSSDMNIFTFGLIESPELSNIWTRVKRSLVDVCDADVHLQMVPSESQIKHVIIRSMDTLVHVAIFSRRGNMHMVHALPDPTKFGMKSDELRVGQTEAAFELITTSAVELNDKFILITKNYLRYLFELPHSQFLECRHDLAKKWGAKFALTPEVTKNLNETLEVMRQLIFDVHVPIWMDGGSLLGWARHCSAIVHERDADFASWAEIHDNKYTLTNELIKAVKRPWYFIESFGLPWSAYELRLYNVKLSWQVDLFFMTQDEQDPKSVYSGYHTFPAVSYYKVYYEKKFFNKLCSGEIFGNKILVPCPYSDVLESEYGDTWVVPNTKHFLKSQPRTHRSGWANGDAPYAYQCLGRYQFDVREMNRSNYKYDPKIHDEDTKFDQSLQDILNEYKHVCNHFRWDRTS